MFTFVRSLQRDRIFCPLTKKSIINVISAGHFGLAKSPDDRRCPGVLHHAGPLLRVGEDHLRRPQLVHLRLGQGVLLLGGLQIGELQTLVVPAEEEAQLAGEQVVHLLDL